MVVRTTLVVGGRGRRPGSGRCQEQLVAALRTDPGASSLGRVVAERRESWNIYLFQKEKHTHMSRTYTYITRTLGALENVSFKYTHFSYPARHYDYSSSSMSSANSRSSSSVSVAFLASTCFGASVEASAWLAFDPLSGLTVRDDDDRDDDEDQDHDDNDNTGIHIAIHIPLMSHSRMVQS